MRLRQKTNHVYAPVDGECVALSVLPDKMFASKMLGDGVAFRYDGSTIHSPCVGTVTMIAATKHAIGIRMDNGAELLLHIGLDTVTMGGRGFDVRVKVGQRVHAGQKLVKIDRRTLNGADLVTPLVIVNSPEYRFETSAPGAVRLGAELFDIEAKEPSTPQEELP